MIVVPAPKYFSDGGICSTKFGEDSSQNQRREGHLQREEQHDVM